jgi:hypothetical protein
LAAYAATTRSRSSSSNSDAAAPSVLDATAPPHCAAMSVEDRSIFRSSSSRDARISSS